MAERPLRRSAERTPTRSYFDDPATEAASFALGRLQRLLASRRVAARLVESGGVAMSQQAGAVMRALRNGAAQSVAELARTAQMQVAAVSRQLAALERDGLLTRTPSPDHGSVVLVRATARGVRVAERAESVRRQHLHNVLSTWSPQDRDRFAELFVRFVDDLQHTPLPEPR